jgi:hypothetical protein
MSEQAKVTPETIQQQKLAIIEMIPNYDNMSPNEKLYELCKANAEIELIESVLNKGAEINEISKIGDTCLCIACNKGYENIVKVLIKNKANVNLCRSVNSIMSTNLSSSLITGRRASRYASHINISQTQQQTQLGESPLYLSIKYGFETIAILLIDNGADIYNFSVNENPDFDKSLLQEVIRLHRLKALNKILEFTFEKNNGKAIQWILKKRLDILRQLFLCESLDSLRIVLPFVLENNNRINGELLTHVLNYVLMKNNKQEKEEKAYEILETILEIASTLAVDDDNNNKPKFSIDDLEYLIKSFLATVRALFNKVSSDDNRTELLYFRFSLLFSILKYDKNAMSSINFDDFLNDIDYTFNFFYTKLKDTGENVIKLVEFFITFYDTLVTMNLLTLNNANITTILSSEHVKTVHDALAGFLIQRSLEPLDLRELCRIRIKNSMYPYNFDSIKQLPIIDDKCKNYLFFI